MDILTLYCVLMGLMTEQPGSLWADYPYCCDHLVVVVGGQVEHIVGVGVGMPGGDQRRRHGEAGEAEQEARHGDTRTSRHPWSRVTCDV